MTTMMTETRRFFSEESLPITSFSNVGPGQVKEMYTAQGTGFDSVARVWNACVFCTGLAAVPLAAMAWVPLSCAAIPVVLLARKVLSVVLGMLAYPKAGECMLPFSSERRRLAKVAQGEISALQSDGFAVRRVGLLKSGASLDAFVIGNNQTLRNGKWSVRTLGNMMAVEDSMKHLVMENSKEGMNTLLINGPAIGESGGWPTRFHLGAGVDSALQYLENEVQATHIQLRGLSIGAGVMAEGILQHDFSTGLVREVRYQVISDRSFSTLSAVAGDLIASWAPYAFSLAGQELDGLGAAKKLDRIGILQIVIQHGEDEKGNDGVIPNSSGLANAVTRAALGAICISDRYISHNWALPKRVELQLHDLIQSFLSK